MVESINYEDNGLIIHIGLKDNINFDIINYQPLTYFIMIVKFKKLIWQIIAGIVGIWLAKEFITPGVTFTGSIKTLCLAGLILGLINFFVKPFLNLITLPLKIITLGLIGLIINMGIVWTVSALSTQLDIAGLRSLFWATIIIWVTSLIASRL